MVSWAGGTRRTDVLDGRGDEAISFAKAHARSEAFKTLFREGMSLVETSAAYLDGPGRAESKALARQYALAYATESMRLTTRLMQIASWLLLQRAVNEGELTSAQAASEKHRVRLNRQEATSSPETLAALPPAFVELCRRSLRLQSRVLHLDRAISLARPGETLEAPAHVAAQLARLESAFGLGAESRRA